MPVFSRCGWCPVDLGGSGWEERRKRGSDPRAQPDPGFARIRTPVTYIVLGLLWLPLTAGEGEKGRQDVKDFGLERVWPREGRWRTGASDVPMRVAPQNNSPPEYPSPCLMSPTVCQGRGGEGSRLLRDQRAQPEGSLRVGPPTWGWAGQLRQRGGKAPWDEQGGWLHKLVCLGQSWPTLVAMV